MTRAGLPAGLGRARTAVRARLRAVLGSRRGSAQLGLVLAAAAVAGGMTLGSGVAGHSAHSGYDLAWIGDNARGQAVQVDPALGRANVRLQVGAAGDTLSLQQGNGQLVVVNRTTGRISSIDLGTLLVGGTRAAARGDAVKVLLAGSRLFVADLPRGTIQAVDPATEASVGTPWSAGGPLVDVSTDSSHDVWALDGSGHLLELQWNAGRSTLSPVSSRAVTGAGAGSVLVGHDRGVTLVGAGGTIVRVGTGHDTSLTAPNVHGPLNGPMSSPDQLVPAADPGSGQVVIVGSSTAVVDDVGSLGCPTPGAPTVFDGKVYVPCSGSHRVLVLDPDGHQGGDPIDVPGGDPQLTVSGGQLVIDAPGSDSATVVDGGGHSTSFPTVTPGIGVQNPNQAPPPPPAPPSPQPPTHHPSQGHHPGSSNDGSNNSSTGDVPGHGNGSPVTGGTPTGSATPPAGPSVPTGTPAPGRATASAAVRADGSVVVTWQASDPGGSVAVTRADTGAQVADVPSGGSSATVTVLDPGTTVSFDVTGLDRAGRPVWTAATNTVTTAAAPTTVTGVHVTSSRSGTSAVLDVTWSLSGATSATSGVTFTVDAGGGVRTTTSTTHASLTVPCSAACSGTVSVTASNDAGSASPASGSYSVSAPAAPPVSGNSPGNPAPVTSAPAPVTPPTPPAVQALPAGGDSAITYTTTRGSDATGDPAVVHLTISNPADWRAFTGTCALTDTLSGTASTQSQPVECSASGLTKDLEYYARGTHVYAITATNPNGTVSSASVSVLVPYTTSTCLNFSSGLSQLPPCQTCGTTRVCPIPFAQVPLFGTSAAAQADTRRSVLALVRSIW